MLDLSSTPRMSNRGENKEYKKILQRKNKQHSPNNTDGNEDHVYENDFLQEKYEKKHF